MKSLQPYGSILKFLVLSATQPKNTVKLIHNKMRHFMFQQLALSTRCRTETQTAGTTVLRCCCKLRETNCPESKQTRGKGNGLDMFAVQVYTKCCIIASVHNLLMHFQGAGSPRHAANWHKIKFGSDMVSWRKTSDSVKYKIVGPHQHILRHHVVNLVHCGRAAAITASCILSCKQPRCSC